MSRTGPAAAPPIRRVLFFLQTTSIGGMESFCADQAQELVRRGYDVRAVMPQAPLYDTLVRRFEASGVVVHRLPGRFPTLAFGRGLLTQLVPLLRSWQPDVVHYHRGNVAGGLVAVLLMRLTTRAVIVYTEHDVPFPGLWLRHQWTTRIMDRVAHGLVAVSRRNASIRLAKLGAVRDRFASILNGIPIPEIDSAVRSANRASVRADLELPDDRVVIGCVVRLVEGKGLETLIRACAQLGSAQPTTLLLVGDGPLRPKLERLAADLGISDSVHFAGFHADPVPFLDAMDVFALAVPAGSMSIALLEAMVRELPPVITFCGPEEAVIHDETGLCAAPDDPAALAQALTRLVDSPALRRQLGTAAAAHVRQHFSMRRCMDDHLELYAALRSGRVPERLRADGPPNNRPGGCPTGGCP